MINLFRVIRQIFAHTSYLWVFYKTECSYHGAHQSTTTDRISTMPTLTQLQYLIAVDRYGHFGKAAKSCHVTQPSLSMQIQKAEDELGLTIFDRIKKPIVTTDRGKLILEQARVILREHAKLIDMSQTSNEHLTGSLNVAVIPTLAPYVIPLFAGRFTTRHPLVQLTVDEMKTNDLVEALKQDRIDVGILATPLNEPGLLEKPIFYEPFFVYAHDQHPILQKDQLDQDSIDYDDLWLLKDGHCFRNQVTNFCSKQAKACTPRNINFEGSNFETLRNVIRHSNGFTMVPQLFLDGISAEEIKVHVRPFRDPRPSREVSLLFRREQWKMQAIDALSKIIDEALSADLPRTTNPSIQIIDI